jgi:hypothetical protein
MQIPRYVIVFLLFLGILLTGFFSVQVFTDPDPYASPEDIVFVTGYAKRVEKSSGLQLWVEGHNSIFLLVHGYTNPEVFEELHNGVPVKVGILKSEQTSPPGAESREQHFLNICSLEVDGRTALSLDGYNRWNAWYALLGKIFVSALFLGLIGGLVSLFLHKRKPVPPDPPVGVVAPPHLPSFRNFVLLGLGWGICAAFFLGIQGWYGVGRAGSWAGPGIHGLLAGISGGFISGVCSAALVAILESVLRWSRKIKNKNSKLSPKVLSVQRQGPTPILFVMILAMMLAYDWNERGWINVPKYVCLTIGFLVVWSLIAVFRVNLKQTPPSSGSKGNVGVVGEAVSSANAPLA